MKFQEYLNKSDPKLKAVAEPIPVRIITGFLGAGKTTLLNRILNRNHGIRIALIVNDFGQIDIDSQLITSIQDNMISLANGCICCTVQGGMVEAIEGLLEQFDTAPDCILIEASGIAEPAGIVRGLNYPQLRDIVRLESVFCLIDAEQIDGLSADLARVARNQLAVSDIVIINKTDLVDRKSLTDLREKWLFPGARIIETSYANIPLSLVTGVGNQANGKSQITESVAPSDHHHHDSPFETWSWTSDAPLDRGRFRNVLKILPAAIYRAKGFVFLADKPDQKGILHLVGTRTTLTMDSTWADMKPQTQLVFIGEGTELDWNDIEQQLEGCIRESDT